MAIVWSGIATAQDGYRPFVEEGKTWHMLLQTEAPIDEPEWNFDYVIQGDTVIDGLEAKKVYSINEDNTGAVFYKMALREEDRKVFFIAPGSEQQYVLYDFNGTIGDVVSVAGVINNNPRYVNLKIIAKNKAHIHGIDRQVYRVKFMDSNNDEDFYSGWWIEGIGSELGPFNTCGFGAVGNVRFLLSCEVNGETIYDGSDQLPDEYVPLLREGVKWVCSEEFHDIYNINEGDVNLSASRKYTIELRGDTVIAGETYKKCYRVCDNEVNWTELAFSKTQPVAFLREEGKKVYGRMKMVKNIEFETIYWQNVDPDRDGIWWDEELNCSDEGLIYDFESPKDFSLASTTEISGIICNVFTQDEVGDGKIIEGIGYDDAKCGDLLCPLKGYQTGLFYTTTGLHHVENSDGNIIYYGMAFNGDAVSGDVDGSGIVDVSDVNAVINIILNRNTQADYPGNGDMDGNGYIDVEDVNAIINIILKVNK